MAGRGITWERVCKNSRDRLAQDGRLFWCRMNPPIIKIGAGSSRRKGSFLAVRTGKGPPDWWALSNGVSILGDDKESKSETWYVKNIKQHQAKDLQKHEDQGGVSCILLRSHDRTRRVIPWKMLKPYYLKSCQISVQMLHDMGAMVWEKPFDDEPNYDWLTPLLRWK